MTERRLFITRPLGRLAWAVLAVALLGLVIWAGASGWYAWHFSGPVATAEQVPPGEAAMTQDIIQTAIRIVDKYRTDTRYLRDAHAKAHGCLRAEVKVAADLPFTLQQGVFSEQGKTWQAWMRLSNGNAYPQFDNISDARGMALKLLEVPGTPLLASQQARHEQDFVMFNHPNFFVSDVAEYRQNIAAQAEGKRGLAFFPSLDPRTWQIRHLAIAMNTLSTAPDTPADATYYSVSPYRYGTANAKFRVLPEPSACPAYSLPPMNRDQPNFLRGALYQQLSTDRQPACFALQVQLQNANRFMPLEDASVQWKESDSAFQTVAHIRLPPQDFDTPEQNLACDNLRFSPWHGIEAHRPLGGINRLRKAVYEAVADYRQARNAQAQQPGVAAGSQVR
jgi:catalase